uniref:Putative secreted protein n=1 Tax=Ixodes ricinus TaxID=34613 RepID=A0A6B0UEZ4_IXORI
MSYTSLSCAMSCVLTWPDTAGPTPELAWEEPCGCGPVRPTTWPVSRPQMVQVVSMLEVPRRLGSTSFQSKEVRGAQKSEFLLLFSRHSSRVSSAARHTLR